MAIQSALKALGFDPQGIDGICGEGTLRAISEFTREHGVPGPPSVDNFALIDALADAMARHIWQN